MNSRNTIQEELKALNSNLPPLEKPVFSVPDGYFENFAASVLLKLKAETAATAPDELAGLSPVLAGLSRKMPLSVPENYFASLANEIPVLIGNDPLPSILMDAGRQNAYTVPTGYFENLPAQLLAKVKSDSGAKVISMGRPRRMRMAAAAVITGCIALAAVLYFKTNNSVNPAQQDTWVAQELKGIPDSELEEFVNTTDVAGTTASTPARATEVRSLLKDVSDSELESFLNAVPADDELLN